MYAFHRFYLLNFLFFLIACGFVFIGCFTRTPSYSFYTFPSSSVRFWLHKLLHPHACFNNKNQKLDYIEPLIVFVCFLGLLAVELEFLVGYMDLGSGWNGAGQEDVTSDN